MKIEGKRISKTRYIQTDRLVVAVDVEMVFPKDDESEPCYESETVRFLKDVTKHAEQNDIPWLSQHGRVYTAMETM